MTESADKTEGQQATLHNSAAVQQCEQFSFSFCPFHFIQQAVRRFAAIFLAAVSLCMQMKHFMFFTLVFIKIFSS